MNIPSEMRAFRVLEFGAAPAFETIPVPAPGAGQVLLRVSACETDARLTEACTRIGAYARGLAAP